MATQILHKYIDFTQNGGYPLTQDDIEFLQDGYSEALLGLVAAGGNITGPMCISGMAVSTSGSDVTVTGGWFVYNQRIIPFTGATVTVTGGNVALVEITESATNPEEYENGSLPESIMTLTATVIAAPTATNATHFPLSALAPWGRDKDWQVISAVSVLPSHIAGTVYYKKDMLNNLYIKTQLATTTLGWADPFPNPQYYEIMTFPVGYRPQTTAHFVAKVGNLDGFFKDSSNVEYLKEFNCKLEPNGKMYMQPIAHSGGSPTYGFTMDINVCFTLD